MQSLFDSSLEIEFNKVYKKLKELEKKSDNDYKSDLSFLLEHIQVFEPLESQCEHEDFNVVAIDGSGASELITLNNIYIHLITAGFSADRTDFRKGTTRELKVLPPICTYPNGITRLVLIREDEEQEVWEEFKSFIYYNYGKKPEEVVFEILKDFITRRYKELIPKMKVPTMNSSFELHKAASLVDFKTYNKDVAKFSEWMINPKPQKGWYDQFREVLEYSLAFALLKMDIDLKYLFLDGSLNLLISPHYDQPRLVSNYLLRDLCAEAMKKNTCVVAVSKTTTFPFIYRIAKDVEKSFNGEKKWFFRIPNRHLGEQNLKLLANKPHIPPAYAITYLFHFSSELPVLRIDFDLDWWMKNIYSSDKNLYARL
ncbi:MAG: hypothetical protein ACTSPI_08185, partial [Candidatus Heimdallarchaeaceae archaeon]